MAVTLPPDVQQQLESAVASGMFTSVEQGLRVAVDRFINEARSYELFPPGSLTDINDELEEVRREDKWVDGETFFAELLGESREMREKYGERLPPESSR